MKVHKSKKYTYLEAEAVVRRLGIINKKSYHHRYHEDPMLPSVPEKYYDGEGWLNWYVFLGNADRSSLYVLCEEAQAAAVSLGIKSRLEYISRYREDPKLPAEPPSFYKKSGWPGRWDLFLKIPKYSYDEARAAVLKLGIKTSSEYSRRYVEDPMLVSDPRKVFTGDGWVNWFHFTDKTSKPIYTYDEACAACQKLGIRDATTYAVRYKEDPCLPCSPHQFYAGSGWKDWYCYLGKKRFPWYTYNEAKKISQKMGIKSNSEYFSLYRKDKKLPSAPEKVYQGIGWVDWYSFLGNNKPEDFCSEYPCIMKDAELWIKTQTSIPIKRSAVKLLVNRYVRGLSIPDDPLYILSRANAFEVSFYTALIEELPRTSKQAYHNSLVSFFGWLLEQYCVDEDSGERIVLPEYRNPLQTVLSEYFDGSEKLRPSQSVKPVLGYEYILRARNYLVPNGDSALMLRPALKNLPHLQEVFDAKWDWLDVEEKLVDVNDPNCVWRLISKPGHSRGEARIKQYQVWSPLRFVALYALLRYPLRGQQILWLDSGEADKEKPIFGANGAIAWVANKSHLVTKGRQTRRPQGVVQQGNNDTAKCYITTNKTGRKVGGYEVDWIPDDLVYWLIVLRDWQSKYNPLERPTAWTDIELPAETNNKILRARKSQCFLFRVDASGQPLIIKNCFALTLPAVLYRIQRDAEDLAVKAARRGGYSSKYTPHSLRVSLITAYVADGHGPIHVISKLVGHSSLVMTVYYTKLNSEQIRRPMGEIEKLAAQRAAERSLEAIRLDGLSAVKEQLIATDGNRALLDSDILKTACVVFDFGICPMSAAGCHMGGNLMVQRQKEEFFNPVEAGYLGQKNCSRCRFFITGVPFLGGLVSLANEISLEINTESARYEHYADVLNDLEEQYYDSCRDGSSFVKEVERKQAVGNQESSAGKLEILLRDYAALHAHIQSCLKLINQNTANNCGDIRLITSGEVSEMGVAFQESDSSYHLLAEICQNARIYKSANPSRAIPLVSQAIDRMAENNGLPGCMFKLTDQQKLVVVNELTNLLVLRLGSWERIDSLFAGNLTLLDIDVAEPSLKCISNEVRQVLSCANQNPVRALTQRAACGE